MTRLPEASPGSLRFRLALFSGFVLLHAWLAGSHAQITLDGSLGPRGPLTGPNYRIGADVGQIRGGNLFHSFEQFNVPTGGSATFSGPPAITNILSRVTGGQPSTVDGVLRSEIAGANLYLLNPSGVLFGPNASLNVSGSFHTSTADFLRLADGTTFFTTLGQESVLTVAPPAAFGFLGNTPAPITIQGSRLQVPAGNALSVVGGDIAIVGSGPLTPTSVPTLGAPRGRLQLVSVAAPGEVVFSPLELAPDLQVDSFARLGRLTLSQGALVDVSGNGGGTVLVRSGHLRVDGSTMFADNLGNVDGSGLGMDLRIAADAVIANGSLLTTNSLRAGRARDLRLTAGSVQADGSTISSTAFASGGSGNVMVNVGNLTLTGVAQIGTGTLGAGNAGRVEVRGRRFTLTGGAEISTGTLGLGRAAEMTVVATDVIAIAGRDSEGKPSGIFSNTFGRGDAGRLFVSAPTLTMEDGGAIQAVADRRSTGGNAGNIEVRGGQLTLTGGAQITSSTRSLGRGGEVLVVATDTIAIAGRGDGFLSGIFSNTFGRGDAGRLFVSAPTLTMEDNGVIQAATSDSSSGNAGSVEVRVGRLLLTGGAQLASSTRGSGRGGTLTVAATDTLSIAGHDRAGHPSGLFSTTQGRERGGDIDVTVTHLQLSDGGFISASSTSAGDAGTIRLQIGDTFRSENGIVTTATAGAGGGAIVLTAGRLVQLLDSALTTSVRGGGSDAGNITLDAPLVVLDGSRISANAFGGRGGNIGIGAQVFLADPASLVSASSTLGLQGTVNIQAPVTALSGTLAPLPQAVVQAATLLPARCAARFREGKTSSLALGGRGGLPLEPGGVLPSPLLLEERLAADPTLTGDSHRQASAARFTLLTGQEKALPRLAGECAK